MDSEPPSSPLIDVRGLPREERHPLILATFDRLAAGTWLEILNNHDPLPLHYQFQVERRGLFGWQYLQRGPKEWRVRITRLS